MKKIIVSLLLLITVGATTVSAAPVTPDPQIEKIFQKEFAGAEHVKWDKASGYFSASFVLAGRRTQAWFSAEGELLGTVRGVLYNQLPLVVIRSLQQRFSDAILYDISEVVNTDGTKYKFTIESKAKKYKVSITPDGNIEEAQRIKK
ncbi:MAG TPA: hypothetical protein VF476_10195 [Chitinophagaceae bacterium]